MKKKLKKIFIFVGLIFTTIILVGCNKGKSQKIVGCWKYDDQSDYVYIFKKDGTGKYEFGGTTLDFTYDINGNKISITYDITKSTFETEFSIKGNKLNIKDSFGNDTIYIKK